MKKLLSLMLIIFLMGMVTTACKKKEEEQPPAKAPIGQGPLLGPPDLAQDTPRGPKVELNIVVPQEVKDTWSGVMLVIEDTSTNTTTEFTTDLDSELKIPDSTLVVKVGHFLPDFKLGAQVITSASNDPNNPAVGIQVLDGDQQIFPESGKWGWLYSKHPTIHPFQHDRFKILLKEGVKKS